MQLFKIECIADEKRLGAVYAALTGLVYNISPPVALRNAEVVGGKVRATDNGKSGPMDMANRILAQLKTIADGSNEVTPTDIRKAAKAAGYSEASYSYAIDQMRKAKLIRLSRRGQYRLLSK